MNKNKSKNVCIIGGGVSGLTCGIKLKEAGYQVCIIAENLSPHTTSDVAAALWRPYHLKPNLLAEKWALESLDIFKKLTQDKNSGVSWLNLLEVYKHKRSKPEWMNLVESTTPAFVPNQYAQYFSVRVPLIDTSIYMNYLMQQFNQLGGSIIQRHLNNLHEVKDYDVIVNCSGIGSRQLVPDDSIFPIKGQIIHLSKPKDLTYGLIDHEDKMIYIYPRTNDCIIGVTAEEKQWELKYGSKIIEKLIESAADLIPSLGSQKIIQHNIGIQPSRPTIRLEISSFNTKKIIHNYGHGGRGFTLSWGCASEVLKLLTTL